MYTSLRQIIESVLREPLKNEIYHTGKVETVSGKNYFLKTGDFSVAYQCEAHGLNELRKTNIFLLPEVISVGDNYILTQYIERGKIPTGFYRDFGRKLALLHKQVATSYGFYEDNYIGGNRQLNVAGGEEQNNWREFYFNKRLMYQYQLAEKKGYVSKALKNGFSEIGKKVDRLLNQVHESPSLLHGDLWSGNYLCNIQGEVVLIDPAVYYGHRETDLAMTKLFGGFPEGFYKAYQEEYPLAEGWQEREPLYKLYHVLNHLNLFGKSYLSEAEYLVSLL